MKLVPILASIVTGFAMLATVGSASASATEFDLSGTFASNDLAGTTGLAGGSFNGTYSYSGDAISGTGQELLSSFSINLLNSSGIVVDTFNSNNSGNTGAIAGNTTYDTLLLQTPNTGLQLSFPTNFDGIASLSNISPSAFYNSGILSVTSATSTLVTQAVPEPSTIPGILAASAGLMVMGLNKSKKQRAFQVG